ncbi:hypothetical protein [Tellurirhabdus bombi]|uniref:hypothetical protein n=1 Tax=Tellurirhabdus bombi TaxID=2907205 RepID=UPI001F339146|nr:hypothetical protein [Tellurirhabdus bombi]
MSPFQNDVKTQSGTSLLVGTAKNDQPLTLLTNAKDVRLVLDVMLAPGSDAVLSLGSVGVRIVDSWAKQGLSDATFGSLSGTPALLPAVNACQAPGIWQRLEIVLQSSEAGPALLEKLTLNGVLLHENRVLPNLISSAGTVALKVNNGTVAVRPVGYQLISSRNVARITDLKYKFYEAKTETTTPAALPNLRLVKEDTLSMLTYEVSFGQPRWHAIVYSGNLVVDKEAVYTLAIETGGYASLQIDGKDAIPLTSTSWDLGKKNAAKVKLTAGSHPFTLFFGKSWPRPGLGLFISAPDSKLQALHARASLPEPDPIGLIAVRSADKPSFIRSFVQLPGEKAKRTHCLSVGTPTGLNYTLDLNRDALLQVWRGDFADVTEMWYERGEPQLLEPLGAPVAVSGQTSLAMLSNEQQAWPDSLGDTDFMYKGMKLDTDGNPTTQYQLYGLQVTDDLRPDANNQALNRTITINGSAKGAVYCRLAAGSQIEEVGKGVYAIGDHRYFVRIDPKLKPLVRSQAGQQELLLPVNLKNSTASINYALIW